MAGFCGVSARAQPKSTDRLTTPFTQLHLSPSGLRRYTARNNQSLEVRLKIRASLPFSRLTHLFLIFVLSVGIWLVGGTIPSRAADLFSVVNVASDDELNVRAGPSADAQKIGTLAFNASSVIATGLSRQAGRATWMEIEFAKSKGWVNAAYLTAITAPREPTLFREPLSCSGTEPFWALQVDGRQGDFDSLTEGKSRIDFSSLRAAHGAPNIWALKGKTENNQSSVFALLEETKQCSDGMSDLTFRYTIRIDLEDGPFYAGCCNPHPGQQAP
jgi:uncharacterized membrane protein